MQVCFYGKKRVLKSLDLMTFFCPQGANEKFFIPDEMFSIDPTEALNKKMGTTFNYHDAKRGWCFPINDAQKTIGVIFYPSDKPLSPQKKTVLLSLKQRLSDGIKINDLEFKLEQTHKDLSHKMLEVESLI